MADINATAWFPGTDPRAYTQAMFRVREAVFSGHRPDVAPRGVIGASWRRVHACGLDPGGQPGLAPLADTELRRARERSGLQALLPQLRAHLLPAAESAGQLMVVADVTGRVLWREGTSAILKHADTLGFVGGSAWTESNVGTNAIGTCIVTEAPIHIHAAEHYADTHTPWTCAAAPLHDPLSGALLGVVDLSGPARTVHAGTLSLVSVAARLAELEIRVAHQEKLTQLRALAAPMLARLDGKAMVVAQDGAVAAVTGLAATDFVSLPSDLTAGSAWLPVLGQITAEPLRGGWLLRVQDDADGTGERTVLVLDLSQAEPEIRVSGSMGGWTQLLSPRHAEIVLSLVRHRDGRTAAQLADDIFADPSKTVTVRAEMSRLRRTLGPLLSSQPYRIAAGVEAEFIPPSDRATLLWASSAPIVTVARAG